jgi:hypothetical protein
MIFRSLCAFILCSNIEKMLLQITSGFLQLESTLCTVAAIKFGNTKIFLFCKLFVTLTMLLTYQFRVRLRQSVECAQR